MSYDLEEGHKSKPSIGLSAAFTVIVGVMLVLATLLGVIGSTLAIIVFLVVILGLIIFHGGAASMGSGLSDAEGYEKQLEEEEKAEAQEAGEGGGED